MATVSSSYNPPPVPLTRFQLDAVANVRAYLSSSQTLSATVAAIAGPIEDDYCEGRREAFGLAWQLWDAMIVVAKSLPHNDPAKSQLRLVCFFETLKARPDPQVPANRLHLARAIFPYPEEPIWGALQLWGWALRETMGEVHPTPLMPHLRMATSEEWTNLNAFLARLTNAGVSDESFFGLVMMKGNLEVEMGIEEINTVLPASAVWIFYAGKHLFMNEWDGHATAFNIRPEGLLWQGPLFKICKERCALWKVRFMELAGRVGIAEVVKEFAMEAHRILVAIEEGGSDRSEGHSYYE